MAKVDDTTDPLAQQMQQIVVPKLQQAAFGSEAEPFVRGAGLWLGVYPTWETIGAQIDPQYSILAGHLLFLVVIASPRAGILVPRGATA